MSTPQHDPTEALLKLYDEHPYPAKSEDMQGVREGWAVAGGVPASYFHLYWPDRAISDDLDILVAGCGATQAVMYALRQPGSRVVGVDLSEASLDHARSVADRYDVSNLELRRFSADDVGALGQSFDLVVCTGVLHLLDDPAAGLRALRAVMKEDGRLLGRVFGRHGLVGAAMIREYCQLADVTVDAAGVDELKAVLELLPPSHPYRVFAAGSPDVGHPAALADILVTPGEKGVSVPELYEQLDETGLSLRRFYPQAPYTLECSMLQRSPHRNRLAELPPRQLAAALELFRGNVYQHTFISARDDAPQRDDAPFGEDRWRRDVPVRLPGVRVVEAAHVASGHELRHEAHLQYPEIAMPLDDDRLKLLQAIDGKRTIEELAGAAGLSNAHDDPTAFTLAVMQALYRLDAIAVRVDAASAS